MGHLEAVGFIEPGDGSISPIGILPGSRKLDTLRTEEQYLQTLDAVAGVMLAWLKTLNQNIAIEDKRTITYALDAAIRAVGVAPSDQLDVALKYQSLLDSLQDDFFEFVLNGQHLLVAKVALFTKHSFNATYTPIKK